MSQPIVLIVDDDDDIREALAQYLRRALDGVGVLTAGGAHDAIRTFDLGHVDVILSDHFMPDGLGTDVLRLASERSPKTVRLLMTAYPESDVLIQATNGAHVEHIFTKPLEPLDVAAIVSQKLDNSGRYPARPRRRSPCLAIGTKRQAAVLHSMDVAGIPQLQPAEAAAKVDEGALLVDVREPEEHAQARVPGALFIPLRQIPERLAELPQDRPLILMCAAGMRSQQAASFLAGQGYQVANLMHGINGWYRMGLAVDTSRQ